MVGTVDFGNGYGIIHNRVGACFEIEEVVANFNGTTRGQIPSEVTFLNDKGTPRADANASVKFVVGGVHNEVH